MFRRILVLLGLALWLAASTAAFADGKFYGTYEVAPTIPDQEALIAYDPATRIQTLVIQTKFQGEGTDFAWVVPIPGGPDRASPRAPEIFAATTGTFPTLRSLFQPFVRRDSSIIWPFLLGILGPPLLILLLRKRHDYSALATAMLVLVLVVVVAGVFLPALGKARGIAADQTVSILDSRCVGAFDTTTIASADPAALGTWLSLNGFKSSPESDRAIAAYVKEGWVFVVSKLRRDAQNGPETAHPLGFRFWTARAVYPMRLTGIGNADLSLDLYVFGPGTARATGLNVVRSSTVRVEAPTSDDVIFARRTEQLRIGHPGILGSIGDCRHATKLAGVLGPSQQVLDIAIEFGAASSIGELVYSTEASGWRSADWGAGLLLAVWAISLVGSKLKPAKRAACIWLALLAIPACIGVGLLDHALTPRLRSESEEDLRRVYPAYHARQSVTMAALFAANQAQKASNRTLVASDIRPLFLEELKDVSIGSGDVRPPEGDIPFGWVLRDGKEGPELVFHDAIGMPHVTPLP